MNIEVIEEAVTDLADYAGIPIAFEVSEIFDVVAEADGNVRLEVRRLPVPYMKDYDEFNNPGEWAERFDLSNWGFLSAFCGGQRVGRAAVAWKTPELDPIEGRSDVALLWDIRVAPSARRRGAGSALFEAAVTWASVRGCRQLEVETQNVNVPACRFYATRGCVLRAVHRGAYPELPDEIQLLWARDLPARIRTGDTA